MAEDVVTTITVGGRTALAHGPEGLGLMRGAVERVAGVDPAAGERVTTRGPVYPVPEPTQFLDEETGEALDFLAAEDLTELAGTLAERHPDLLWTARAFRVTYFWKAKGGKKGGKLRLGQCQKATPLLRHMGATDLVVWLAADHLRRAPCKVVEAVLFHEMNHIGVGATRKPKLRPHDLEEFRAVVKEYGVEVFDDVRAMAEAMQLALPLAGRGT